MTTDGELYDLQLGASAAGLPKGVINRTEYDGSILVGYTAWGTKIIDLIDLDRSGVISFSELIAMVMLLVSFILLLTINLLQAWTRKRGQSERT